MKYKQRLISVIGILLTLVGCANHPTMMPGKLETGESRYVYTFSAENIVPVYTWQYGLNDRVDGAVHVGLPIWGTGLSFTYLMGTDTSASAIRFSKFNIGYTYQHNSGFDATLVRERMMTGEGRYIYYGLRSTYIPKGISGTSAVRFGVLVGSWWNKKMGFELGYTYDFELETEKIDPVQKWPTEHNNKTGVSVRLSFGQF